MTVVEPAGAAEEECQPDPEFSHCVRFTYSGGDQTFVVPDDDVYEINVRAWGAGGGGYGGGDTPGHGGSGGFSQGTIEVEPDDELTVVVGGRGTFGSDAMVPTYGGGGAGGGGETHGASGGGMSGIFDGDTDDLDAALLVAGGGGGGTFSPPVDPSGPIVGGSGGGEEGGHHGGGGVTTGSGAHGTQTEGGGSANSFDGCHTDPEAGDELAGGSGSSADPAEPVTGGGGGGGGGLFGGGGGACDPGEASDPDETPVDADNGAGGGGSGYLDERVIDGTTHRGTKTDDSQYVEGIGMAAAPGGGGAHGGHGMVVIQYVVELPPTGSSTGPLVRLGFGLVAAGAGVLVLRDRQEARVQRRYTH